MRNVPDRNIVTTGVKKHHIIDHYKVFQVPALENQSGFYIYTQNTTPVLQLGVFKLPNFIIH